MDPMTPVPNTYSSLDQLTRDLAEIDAAIALVVGGVATRVRLVGLARPDATAAVALARSQAAGLRFEVDRGRDGIASLTVGPRGNRQRVG
jgi:hypothetical protein